MAKAKPETIEEIEQALTGFPERHRENTNIRKFAEAWPDVLAEIAGGGSFRKSLEARKLDARLAYQWMMAHPERLRRYNEAYTVQADTFADRITEIAEYLIENGDRMGNAHVSANKVAIDALIWACAIRNRKKYGEHKTIEVEAPIDPRSAREQLATLRRELAPVLVIVEQGQARREEKSIN